MSRPSICCFRRVEMSQRFAKPRKLQPMAANTASIQRGPERVHVHRSSHGARWIHYFNTLRLHKLSFIPSSPTSRPKRARKRSMRKDPLSHPKVASNKSVAPCHPLQSLQKVSSADDESLVMMCLGPRNSMRGLAEALKRSTSCPSSVPSHLSSSAELIIPAVSRFVFLSVKAKVKIKVRPALVHRAGSSVDEWVSR